MIYVLLYSMGLQDWNILNEYDSDYPSESNRLKPKNGENMNILFTYLRKQAKKAVLYLVTKF